jgi:hypothetical protein
MIDFNCMGSVVSIKSQRFDLVQSLPSKAVLRTENLASISAAPLILIFTHKIMTPLRLQTNKSIESHTSCRHKISPCIDVWRPPPLPQP